MAAGDPSTTYPALWTLVAAGNDIVPFFKQHLRPEPFAARQKRIAQLIQDLDRDEFKVREKAFQELRKLGQAAERALRTALKQPLSLEVQRRLERLLKQIKQGESEPFPEDRRLLRAIRILELVGTPGARQLLTSLAKSAPESDLAWEATQAVERLSKRKSNSR